MDAKLEAAHRDLTERVMDRPGVVGTAIGERGGELCLVVYLKSKQAGRDIPKTLAGFRVVREVTGSIRAF
jgi:hypothetical protein